MILDIETIQHRLNAQFNDVLSRSNASKRWFVSYSGGLDSSVMLHALDQWLEKSTVDVPSLHVLHINHHLNSNSQQWSNFCQETCAAYGLEFEVHDVTVDLDSGLGLEASARQARYAVYAQQLQAGDWLFQGHHANDQLETFLLRLMRGAGVKGLRSIPQQRVQACNQGGEARIFRPLLAFSRAELEAYAKYFQLTWVDDDSNADDSFDRNYIRQHVVPTLQARWPDALNNTQRSVAWLSESFELNQQLALIDLRHCEQCEDEWGSDNLSVKQFLSLSMARRKNCLREWIASSANISLSAMQLKILSADDFSRLEIFNDDEFVYSVERFQDRLCLYRRLHDENINEFMPLALSHNEEIEIQNVGVLQLEYDTFEDGVIKIKFRQGGERAQPQERERSQQLKKLFQEYKVPPWWRSRVPLIYWQDQLIAVGDLWLEKKTALKFPIKVTWKRFS